MYKKLGIVLFIIIASFLSGCSSSNMEKNNNSFLSGQNKVVGKLSKKSNVKGLSSYQKEIIKIAIIGKKISLCSKLNTLSDYCKSVYNEEYSNYKKGDCSKLKYLKQKCLDEKNYKLLNCNNVTDNLLKKKCIFNKKYIQAIKDKDKSFCNLVPRPDRKNCLEKMKK